MFRSTQNKSESSATSFRTTVTWHPAELNRITIVDCEFLPCTDVSTTHKEQAVATTSRKKVGLARVIYKLSTAPSDNSVKNIA
jgi:hypothetical protein